MKRQYCTLAESFSAQLVIVVIGVVVSQWRGASTISVVYLMHCGKLKIQRLPQPTKKGIFSSCCSDITGTVGLRGPALNAF